ncbi:hypothetical protein KAFR_0D01020 [Kazachstania africana CBS 2517]|uniref:Transcription factor spt8 beta-propeller domain-containing protein n=1 Tax=Kazachstania africana (strain ATCC 22294 / BCRC 22015 / CBS 2517 / CECT 1963 / NBRC 1671 / NRRL Y-8276) TaxID=1071382 RepID=H2ATP9_KAZAF|nr:hypothetical protein KAFR_0D01020 [Kazachstania africana CBS 2517]CCF57749.1 hypothetical protein KAFR_0D01020 [Kazachstania africana CBS 2517]
MDEVDDILDQNPAVEEDDIDDEEEEDDEDEDELNDIQGNNNDDDDDDDNDDDKSDDGEEDVEEDQDEENDNDDDERSDVDMDKNNSEDSTTGTSSLDKIHNYYKHILQSAKLASKYSIYPTAAIPIQTHVNALAVSKGLKYLFLGGSDGYIRKYDLLNTIYGKLSLTILQKHSLTESIQNAGILLSYWENEIPMRLSELKVTNNEYEPNVSPVHSIEVHNECLFLLSGLQNGGIALQGVRYMEGCIGHYFKRHNQVVNILRLNNNQDKFLSGSWDRQIIEWDLNKMGSIVNEFKGANSELSSLELRPLDHTVDIPTKPTDEDADELDSLFGDDDEEEDDDANETNKERNNNEKEESPTRDEVSKETLNVVYDESIFMTSGLNGAINVWDRRNNTAPVLNLLKGQSTPPWCFSACWSANGDYIYAGRRNACVEEFDLKMPSSPKSTLKLPSISGSVSCVKSLPNGNHLLIASKDNIRLYDTSIASSSKIPFTIVPGHHGGVISNLYVDPTCRFLISTSGDRGWQGTSTDTTLIYEIDLE